MLSIRNKYFGDDTLWWCYEGIIRVNGEGSRQKQTTEKKHTGKELLQQRETKYQGE